MARDSFFKSAFAESDSTFKTSLQHLQSSSVPQANFLSGMSALGELLSKQKIDCGVGKVWAPKPTAPSLALAEKMEGLNVSMLAHTHPLNLLGHSDEGCQL
jgi:hypothetical protein